MRVRQTEIEQASKMLMRQSHAAALFKDTLTKLTEAIISWRVMALGLLVLDGVFTVWFMVQSNQVKVVPFIAVVDPQNRVLWSGPAGSYRPDDLWVAEALVKWTMDVRSRPGQLQKPGNLAILNQHWQQAYALTDGEASRALAAYMAEENPLKHQADIEVSVTIEYLSPYPLNAEDPPKLRTYHLEWSEDWKIRGVLQKQPRFSGDFWTEFRPDERKGQTEMMTQRGVDRGNPGLYITKFRWDQKLDGLKR